MMSLISAARICIDLFPPARRLDAALGHLLGEARELRPHAPIVYRPSDVEDNAADQFGIDLGRRDDVAAAGETPRELDELVPLARAEQRRRTDRDACSPDLVVEEIFVPAGDVGQDHQ